jgi:hypothetical protein
MTRHAVVHYPGRQQPPASRVVSWSERQAGWWPGLARACPHWGASGPRCGTSRRAC